jgi:hypothetical protein
MRLLLSGLIYIAVSAVAALVLGESAGGLNWGISFVSLIVGATVGIALFFLMPAAPVRSASRTDSSRGELAPAAKPPVVAEGNEKYRSIWLCLVGFVFAIFAFRSFCWLFYFDGEKFAIQSPFNLGDLGLHLTYIKTFANGVSLWPDSPIYVYSKLRYPVGIDLFNGVLTNLGFDLRHQLAATGLLASLATFYALYRWGGTFTVAGFLFNGGIAGYAFLRTNQFLDYQGTSHVSWKSIPLTMFVTQRGLLYAIPAGLLLLRQWRIKYGSESDQGKQLLPVWAEYIFYATMPLFHIHTFIALSIVLLVLFLTRPPSRSPLLKLVGAAVLPAVIFVWLTTDKMHASSILQWHLGWTQTVGELGMPFFWFWLFNFGVFLPLAIALVGTVAREEWNELFARRSSAREPKERGPDLISTIIRRAHNFQLSIDAAYLAAAVLIFLLVMCVKTAPWEWDNIKLLIWAYFITLPILWNRMLVHWPFPARVGVCFILFFSGFVSLIGGLAAGRPGYEFAKRSEIDFVAAAIRRLPIEARFAGFPTYNHPLLLSGRKMVCGYPGHLWTQGITDYATVENQLKNLMLGQGDWKKSAHELRVRYLFWGNLEKTNYGNSTRPWEKQLPLVAQGSWGSIYDFGSDAKR